MSSANQDKQIKTLESSPLLSCSLVSTTWAGAASAGRSSALLALCFSDHLRATGLCITNLYGQHRKRAGGDAFVPQMACGLISKNMR